MTHKIELTDAGVRSINPPSTGFIDHPDSKITGFGLRVMKTGLKTFYFQYRFNGKRPRMGLGRYPDTTLAKARDLAKQADGLLRRGLDPAIHLRLDEDETLAAADIAPEANQTQLFSVALQEYIDKYLANNCRPSTQAEVTWCLKSTFLQDWASLPIGDITPYHVSEIIDRKLKEGKPSAANHALSYIKTFFSWCVARTKIKASPADKIPKPAKKGARERYLNAAEIRSLWLATEIEPNPIAKLVQFALATGQRRGEIAGMRWDELNLKNGYWEIPGSRTKNGLPHVVPLSFLAFDILRTVTKTPMPMNPGDTEIRYSPFVFPAPRTPSKKLTHFTDTKKRLDELAKIEPWCIHDLRRTLTTGLSDIGTHPKVKKKLLNHSENEVHDLYDRFEYFQERCEALHKWAEYLTKAIAGEIETKSIATFHNPYARSRDELADNKLH